MERRPRLSPRPAELTRSQKLEAVRQAISSVEILLQSITNSRHFGDMRPTFDLSKREFRLGQWVDVLDTVNQWLEAQIVEVRETDHMVYINYNGWAARWDEWLDRSSPRLQLFRTHTKQGVYSALQCPLPIIMSPSTFAASDANLETCDLMLDAQGLLAETHAMLNRYRSISHLVQRESQMVRLVQPAQVRGDVPIETDSSASDWLPGSSFTSEEFSDSLEILSPAQTELLIRGQQLAVLSDRLGRILTDLATLSSVDQLGQLQPMPAQSLLTEESDGTDLFIHIYNIRRGSSTHRSR